MSTEPIIEWEDESKHPPDPLADYTLYFKRWELINLEKRRAQRENDKDLSIYELSRKGV